MGVRAHWVGDEGTLGWGWGHIGMGVRAHWVGGGGEGTLGWGWG